MRTVAANIQQLTEWNRSMAVALEKAECGGCAQDMSFIEELRKSAAVLGYSLTLCKEPKELSNRPSESKHPTEKPSERAMRLSAPQDKTQQ